MDFFQRITRIFKAVEQMDVPTLCLSLGEYRNSEVVIEGIPVKFLPYVTSREELAEYYQVADCLINVAKDWCLCV